jgi:hypothetical protein
MGHRMHMWGSAQMVTGIGCVLWCLMFGCGDDDEPPQSTTSGAQEATAPSGADGGSVCRDDGECQSGHCDNHVCCEAGECCLVAEDCSDAAGEPACDDVAGCQGSRATVTCEQHRCTAGSIRQDDDSACSELVKADECGWYAAVLCDGSDRQQAPACPDACADDSACDQGASCVEGACVAVDDADDCAQTGADAGARCAEPCVADADCALAQRCSNGACEDKQGDGERCAGDRECASAHCDRGRCCETGDCCNDADDCPSAYTVKATCAAPETCQGAAAEAECNDHMCLAMVREDDTGCDQSVVARDCGGTVVVCLGTEDQGEPPLCPPPCSSDDDCPEDHKYCRDGECIPEAPDGAKCDDASMCASGYCNNGYCCGSGFCCASSADCAPLYLCTDVAACDGTRLDSVCGSDSRCALPAFAIAFKDDSACLGRVARDCGAYRPLVCGIGLSFEPGDCAWQCSFNWDCSLGRTCHDGACE